MIDFIGESRAFIDLKLVLDKISVTDSSVLITGESGSGKDLAALYLRYMSNRKDGPFVVVNCGALPAELAENELFGHVRGAFTDAVSDYKGKIGQASGGILFLDEVADLSLLLQVKLLRFLQFKTYQPVGSVDELKADVRVIAATNKNLANLVSAGLFREDLYYRLNVVPVVVPPLRARTGDIVCLVKYFVDKYSARHNKVIQEVKQDALVLLDRYSWPGNVRELENTIERTVVFNESGIITGNDVVFDELVESSDKEILDLKSALNSFKKQYVIDVLDKCGWNQTKAAKRLDIQRTYLARLIKELNISKI